jgi:transmembrane sensor
MTPSDIASPAPGRDPRQLLAASLSRALTEAEQLSLDAWAASSAAAREEVAQTREIWLAAGLAAEDPVIRRLRQSARLTARLNPPQHGRSAALARRWLVGGLGLAGAAALVAGVMLVDRPRTERYVAPDHAVAHLALADGSRIALSPGGVLTVRWSRHARTVDLAKGDAFFEVSHDARRPFTVAASGRTLTVLGTRFNVAGGRHLTVSLVQGSLRVGAPGAVDIVLKPGERYVAAKMGGRAEMADVVSDAAWKDGRLVFADTGLTEAAERLSRAAGRRFVLADPALGALRLSGSMKVERIEDVRSVLEASLPVATRLAGNGDVVITSLDETRP